MNLHLDKDGIVDITKSVAILTTDFEKYPIFVLFFNEKLSFLFAGECDCNKVFFC